MKGGDMRRGEKDGKRRRVNPKPKLSESDVRKVRGPSERYETDKWKYSKRGDAHLSAPR